MTDEKRPAPAETPHFETDFIQTDRAREQGLGLGERELKAQRDPGGIATPDVDEDDQPGEPGVVHNLSDDQPS